jgi:hypothetical protein
LLDNSTTTQPVENNQTGEAIQQTLTSKQVITNKTLKDILKDISKQVLETKYILNQGTIVANNT